MKLGSRYKAYKKLYLRLATGVVLVLCVFMSFSVIKRYQLEREMAARVMATQAEFDAFQERKAELEKKVDYLEDDRSVEAQLRRSFDVVKEGEQVIVIIDGDEEEVEVETTAPAPKEPLPWYVFWR